MACVPHLTYFSTPGANFNTVFQLSCSFANVGVRDRGNPQYRLYVSKGISKLPPTHSQCRSDTTNLTIVFDDDDDDDDTPDSPLSGRLQPPRDGAGQASIRTSSGGGENNLFLSREPHNSPSNNPLNNSSSDKSGGEDTPGDDDGGGDGDGGLPHQGDSRGTSSLTQSKLSLACPYHKFNVASPDYQTWGFPDCSECRFQSIPALK